MKTLFALLWLSGSALAIETKMEEIEAPTIGTMEVRSEQFAPAEPKKRQSLELSRLDVTVEIHGDVAQTRVEHDFYNDSNERLEGTFRFPVPTGAEIVGMSMEVDGRMMEGELVERKKAEEIFEKTVDEMRDPALLTWDAGNLFKLRIFPIEPNSHKRVVMRYLTPLKQNGKNARYEFQAQAAQMTEHIGHFRFVVANQTLRDEDVFRPETITVDLPQDQIFGKSLREEMGGVTYLRVKLPIDTDGRSQKRGHFRWVLAVDVSRSALEARRLTIDAVRAALSALPSGDEFTLLACDIRCQESSASFSKIDAASIAQAMTFLESIEFDGATDLEMALKQAAARARGPGGQVLYFGDGSATWGTTDPAELALALEPVFVDVPFHAVVLGKYASPMLLTQLSNRGGGLTVSPTGKSDLAAFGKALHEFGRVARISDLSLAQVDGAILTPTRPASLNVGEELTVFVRSETAPPKSLHVRGRLNGKPFEKEIPIADSVPSQDVARRFATSKIHELELAGGHDEEVLTLSLDHQVLCAKTAWLVLENDEEYRRHQIERRNRESSDAPTVSGKDLESMGGDSDGAGTGEGPEPELWLVLGLMFLAVQVRKRVMVAADAARVP